MMSVTAARGEAKTSGVAAGREDCTGAAYSPTPPARGPEEAGPSPQESDPPPAPGDAGLRSAEAPEPTWLTEARAEADQIRAELELDTVAGLRAHIDDAQHLLRAARSILGCEDPAMDIVADAECTRQLAIAARGELAALRKVAEAADALVERLPASVTHSATVEHKALLVALDKLDAWDERRMAKAPKEIK